MGHGEPVVLLHASPRSSLAMLPLIQTAPDGHALFAIDLPGFGRSAPLPSSSSGSSAAAPIEAFADALAATLTALGLPRVRVYGTHTGAAVAVALAARHPQRVERLVLDGLNVFTRVEDIDLTHDGYLPALEPDADGLHMTWAWNRMRDQALFFPWNARRSDARMWRPLPSPDTLQAATLDLLVASDYRAAYTAALRTDGRAWVARLRVSTRIGARGNDVLRPHLERLVDVPPCVTVAPFANDTRTWAPQVWRALQEGARLDAAPAAADPSWSDTLTDSHRGRAGARLHWRGCRGGEGRPLVYLHDSPGSARVLDARLAPLVGQRPVFACDLPGHGESDRAPDGDLRTVLDALHEGLDRLGPTDAELCGVGAGAWLAEALARRRPRRWSFGSSLPHRGPMPPPQHATTRADGGHLNQAWLDARDAAILGPWWQRDPRDCHDFGDTLDWRAIQREAVERLFEAPQAMELRRSIADHAKAGGLDLTSPSASRTPRHP